MRQHSPRLNSEDGVKGHHGDGVNRKLFQSSVFCLIVQSSHVKTIDQGQGHFSEGSRSFANVMGYSVVVSEIPSPSASFSSEQTY